MSYRTNRKTRGVFKLGTKDATPPPMGTIIRDAPEIVGFEGVGSVYVEDGEGSRYTVKYADGHTSEVEISDALDTEGYGEDEASDEDHEYRNVRVVWDGAVDFEDGYDGNSEESKDEITRSLIKRYGKIAEDFLGTSEKDIDEKIRGTQTPASQLNEGILDGATQTKSQSVGLMSVTKKSKESSDDDGSLF